MHIFVPSHRQLVSREITQQTLDDMPAIYRYVLEELILTSLINIEKANERGFKTPETLYGLPYSEAVTKLRDTATLLCRSRLDASLDSVGRRHQSLSELYAALFLMGYFTLEDILVV